MPEITTETSKQFTVNWLDLGKSILIAAITTVLLMLYPIINASRLPTVEEWKNMGLAALASGLSYVIKNFFTPSQTIVKIQPPTDTIKPTI